MMKEDLEDYSYLNDLKLNSELIGRRIKIARKSRSITQDKIADICDCTPTHISNIENGKVGVSLELLFKLSIILDKRLDYFIMDDVHATPEILIEQEIAPKLLDCDPQMLDLVDNFLDRMITYRNKMTGKQDTKK